MTGQSLLEEPGNGWNGLSLGEELAFTIVLSGLSNFTVWL
jgi:hypothetical protein